MYHSNDNGRIFRKQRVAVAFLAGCMLYFSFVLPVASDDQRAEQAKPIEIVSDRLETFDEEGLAVFSGNVIATQGTMIIDAEQLKIFYKRKDSGKSGKAEGLPRADALSTGQVDRIEALGDVSVKEANGLVTGDHAVFYNQDRKMIMTGNAEMRQGKNIIKGNRITFYLSEGRGIVESSQKGRVKATIYPQEK